jgi:hypothetical protein
LSAADQDVVLDLGFTIATPQAQLLNASSFPDQVQGRIEVDDGSPLPVGALSRFQVVLWGSGGFFRTQPFTNTQGIFTLPAVPGEYVAKVALGMRTYYLKSATYGNIDLTKGPFHPEEEGCRYADADRFDENAASRCTSRGESERTDHRLEGG